MKKICIGELGDRQKIHKVITGCTAPSISLPAPSVCLSFGMCMRVCCTLLGPVCADKSRAEFLSQNPPRRYHAVQSHTAEVSLWLQLKFRMHTCAYFHLRKESLIARVDRRNSHRRHSLPLSIVLIKILKNSFPFSLFIPTTALFLLIYPKPLKSTPAPSI